MVDIRLRGGVTYVREGRGNSHSLNGLKNGKQIYEGGVMQTTNPNLTKHVHWKNLIDHKDMKDIADQHGVFVIVIKPLSPPEGDHDFVAYLLGEGSDYLGKFIHKTTCDWEQV